MIYKKYFPTVVCGFAAAVFSIIPILKNFTSFMFIPGAVILSIYLYMKINDSTVTTIKTGDALLFGLLTGIIAAMFGSCFDLILTFILKTNDLVEAMPYTRQIFEEMKLGDLAKQSWSIFEKMHYDITNYGFSFIYMFSMTIGNLIIYSFFGIVGGLIGKAIINKKYLSET